MPAPPTFDEQIRTIEANIQSFESSFADADGKISDPDVVREIECLRTTRSILLWARAHPDHVKSMGLHLSHEERLLLKGLEAASMAKNPHPMALYRLREKEVELCVFDEALPAPRWQDM